MWGHSKKVTVYKPRRVLTWNQIVWNLNLGLPPSKPVRKNFLFMEPPSLRYFTIAAWTDLNTYCLQFLTSHLLLNLCPFAFQLLSLHQNGFIQYHHWININLQRSIFSPQYLTECLSLKHVFRWLPDCTHSVVFSYFTGLPSSVSFAFSFALPNFYGETHKVSSLDIFSLHYHPWCSYQGSSLQNENNTYKAVVSVKWVNIYKVLNESTILREKPLAY